MTSEGLEPYLGSGLKSEIQTDNLNQAYKELLKIYEDAVRKLKKAR
jgi:hypothetical protein